MEVVLHRVLRRHDVHLLGVDLRQRAVQRGRLTGARGPRDQDHPVRVHDGPHEVLLGLGLEPELLQVERQVALVQDPEHDLLAEDHRQRGDAEVDDLVAQLQLDPPVLGDAPLGDVEVRQDLDAGGERRLHLHRRLHDLLERAVDPVADPDLLLVRLDVDVADALHHGVGEEPVDELDDRRRIHLLLQRRDVDVFVLLLHELEVVLHEVPEQIAHVLLIGRTVVILEVLTERVLADDHRLDVEARLEAHDIDGLVVGGVGHRHGQRPPDLSQREHQMLVGDLAVDQRVDLLVDLDLLQVDRRKTVLLGEHPSELFLIDESEVDEGVADTGAAVLGVGERFA